MQEKNQIKETQWQAFDFFIPRTLLCDYAKADIKASASIRKKYENISVMGVRAVSH